MKKMRLLFSDLVVTCIYTKYP